MPDTWISRQKAAGLTMSAKTMRNLGHAPSALGGIPCRLGQAAGHAQAEESVRETDHCVLARGDRLAACELARMVSPTSCATSGATPQHGDSRERLEVLILARLHVICPAAIELNAT